MSNKYKHIISDEKKLRFFLIFEEDILNSERNFRKIFFMSWVDVPIFLIIILLLIIFSFINVIYIKSLFIYKEQVFNYHII